MRAILQPDRAQAHSILTTFLFVFVLLQPVFDLLSFLYLRGFMGLPIATVAKPFLMGLLNLCLIFLYKKHFWRCAIPYGIYLVLIAVHVFLTSGLQIDRSYILTNIRTSISLLYFLICWFNLRILYQEATDRDGFCAGLTKVVLLAFALHLIFYFAAVLSGTSALTYEHADPNKRGFKGWLDSGQVLAHALCICLPMIVYHLLHNKASKPWLRLLGKFAIVLPVVMLLMIGTKVAYYMPIIVLSAQVVLELFFAIKDKDRTYVWNGVICGVLVCACLLAYPITPVKNNTYWNEHTLAEAVDSPRITAVIAGDEENHITFGPEDTAWSEHAFGVLRQKYESGEMHPGDSRNRQMTFNFEKFKQAGWAYKLFGIGHWNQQAMAMERDVLAVFFGFGILPFLCILLRPILLWLQSAFAILRRLLRTNLVTLCLFEGFSMAFFLSWYAGSTFIYPQFTFFLAILMCLLTHQIQALRSENGRI